jgi:hypothetical protein
LSLAKEEALKRTYPLLLAVLVLLSGLALVPVMGLPSAGFRWQFYANSYVLTTLEVNHPSGAPGSFFTVTGTNYPLSTTVTIFVNGADVGDVPTDEDGNLEFVIDTTGAELGTYTVWASPVPSVFTRFVLEQDADQWPQEGTAPVIQLPADLARELIFAPVVINLP